MPVRLAVITELMATHTWTSYAGVHAARRGLEHVAVTMVHLADPVQILVVLPALVERIPDGSRKKTAGRSALGARTGIHCRRCGRVGEL